MLWKLRAAFRIATERDPRVAEASYRVLTEPDHRITEASYRLLMERDPSQQFELWKELSALMAPGINQKLLDILAWPTATEEEKFAQLTCLAQAILPEYRFTWPQQVWWKDAKFNEYLARFGELNGFNTHRRWMVHEFLRLCASIPGDTAECGVYQGAGSYLMAQANRARGDGSLHHAFDSFEGLSRPTEADGKHWYAGALACDLDTVKRNLQEFGDEVRYYPGWIPTRFPEVADCRFRFVYLDLDLYEPTCDSLAFFYPRLQRGGLLVCDDYMMGTCPGVKQAVDEFLLDKPEKMLGLAEGGGVLIKDVPIDPPALAAAA